MGDRLVLELLVIRNGVSSGYQEYVFNLLNYFYDHRDEISYKQIIIWCNAKESEAFSSYKEKFEIKGFKVGSYWRRFWLQSFLPIKEKLTKNDLLFSPGNTSGLIKRSLEVLTIHDLLFKRKDWLPIRAMRWHRNIMIPISIKKADKIIAISNFTKDDILHYYPKGKGKIEVVYNSMNFAKFDHERIANTNGNYFLAICSNAYHKNLKTILKAFGTYCNNGGTMNLFFVGRIGSSGHAYEAYNILPENVKERIITKAGIPNAELGALYENASCYVSASLFEGLGMPVVEAMYYNLPVLLSDIPPHREVSMNLGTYFHPLDSDELAHKMLTIDTQKMSYKDEVVKAFSEKETSAKYIEHFNSLIGK